MEKFLITAGINNYKNPNIGSLRGCHDDVFTMASIAQKHFGFKQENMRVLLDGAASQQGIINNINELKKKAKDYDIFCFHFSGHGSKIVDLKGDEIDGYTEIICPYDMDWNNPFTDDLTFNLLSDIPKTVQVVTIFDCCHSGTANRSPIDNPCKSRYLTPPTALIPNEKENHRSILRPSLKDREKVSGIHLAGCMDDQTSADDWIDQGWHGAFTYYLNFALKALGYKAEYEIVMKYIAELMKQHNYQQTPIISEGRFSGKNLMFFGGQDKKPISKKMSTKKAYTKKIDTSKSWRKVGG